MSNPHRSCDGVEMIQSHTKRKELGLNCVMLMAGSELDTASALGINPLNR